MRESQGGFVELHRYEKIGTLPTALEIVECPELGQADAEADWRKTVSAERASVNLHFFRREREGVAWWAAGNDSELCSRESLHALAVDLASRGVIEAGKPVRLTRGVATVRELPPVTGGERPAATLERVWTPTGLKSRIARDMKDTLPRLAVQLRSRLGVLPFVGAGMSAGFGFPQWREFLEGLAERIVDASELAGFREEKSLEVLAERLWKLDSDAFQNAIEARFDSSVDPARLRNGALATLAHLVEGPVITTNFDHVLEDAFEACGRPFKGLVHGARPDSIVRAVHQDLRHLLKIHGDCRDRTLRTFTLREYEQNYTNAGAETTLTSLGWLMFTQRPLLFLGSSLETDRTVDVLKRIHAELRGISHYAILAAKYREAELVKRRRELAGLGIAPLWFCPGDFGQIGRYLSQLLELTNSRELSPAPVREASAAVEAKPAARATAFAPGVPDAPAATTTRRIANAIVEGRVAFLLGNYVHLGAVRSGDEFYEDMGIHFGVPDYLRDRSEVARYVLDRTPLGELFAWYSDFIDEAHVAPSSLVQLLAELPGFLRSKRRAGAAGITFLTTNYDLVLERALEAAGEPFHWFYYLSEAGTFAYRSPDGAERIVERPERFRTPLDDSVCLVKLNGGLVYGREIPHSVCIARGDFERLAARLPACLPSGIRARIDPRSLLCLGHGLYELDVDQLIRHIHSGARRVSWAIQKVPSRFKPDFETRREYWSPFGLELVERDLADFTSELGSVLARQ